MRLIFLMLMAFALTIGLACQNASSTSMTDKENSPETAEKQATAPKAENLDEHGHESGDEAPRISLEDAKKAFDAGEVVFVDTRAENSYKNEHIKGAINIPASDFEARYNEIPKDKKIIAYCS